MYIFLKKAKHTLRWKELHFFFNQVVEYLMKESILQLVTNVETWCKPAKIFFLPCQSPSKRDVTVTYMGQIMLSNDSKHTFLD